MTEIYDPEHRRTAAALSRRHPHWLVLWGVHSRLFWGFPLFSVPPGTMIGAATPEDLAAQMRQVEMTATFGPPPYNRQLPAGAG